MPHDNAGTGALPLADQAQARTIVPEAGPEPRPIHHGHGHGHGDYDHDHDDHGHDHSHAFSWIEGVRIGLVALAAALVWFRVWEPLASVSLIGIAGLLVGGWPIYREAFGNLLARRMTMELSMTIAIVAAAAIGEFFTALVITLFVLVAEVLEGMTVSRGRKAISDLLDFLPRSVSVRRPGGVSDIHADDLRVGDAVLVNPGGRVPVDGTVISGHSFLDQSRITGESMPVEKVSGAPVYAGSINQSGALEIRAERIGRDTSYGKIIEAVENAERTRAPVQKLADRMAGYLVYFALASAALTFLITQDITATISVVIVAGACGIAAGTPLAILGGIGRAARLGAIIKGGLYLETLGRVDTIVLDKTGTLTFGKPEVQAIASMDGITSDQVLDAAAAAEARSEHPLGQAIVAHARDQGRTIVEPDRFTYTPGRGIAAIVGGEMIHVGNRILMSDADIDVPAGFGTTLEAASEIFSARGCRRLGHGATGSTAGDQDPGPDEASDHPSDRRYPGRRRCGGPVPWLDGGEVRSPAGGETGVRQDAEGSGSPGRDVGRRNQRCPGARRGRCRCRDGIGHGCGARERGHRAARQRLGSVR